MPASNTTPNTTPVYMIVNADIHDPIRFAEYGRANAALVKQFGGKYLVLGGARETLEGEWWDGKSVISEWASREAALAYWHSPQYAEVRKLREGICTARVVLVDGFLPHTNTSSSPSPASK